MSKTKADAQGFAPAECPIETPCVALPMTEQETRWYRVVDANGEWVAGNMEKLSAEYLAFAINECERRIVAAPAGGQTPTPFTVSMTAETDPYSKQTRIGVVGPNGETFLAEGEPKYPFGPKAKAEQRAAMYNRIYAMGQASANAALVAERDACKKALEAAIERMEAVSESLPVNKRADGVSQAAHVQHLAGHLYQHAKIARAALAREVAK